CLLRDQGLACRYVSGHRSGADRGDDREPPHRTSMEAVHAGAGSAIGFARPGLHQPAYQARTYGLMEPLERWLDRQYRHSAAALLRSVSAVQITKIRQGFG